MKKKEKLTDFEKNLKKNKLINTKRIKNGKIVKPLTKVEIQQMVDANNKKLAELKSQGKTRCPLEMEKAFKENKKQH